MGLITNCCDEHKKHGIEYGQCPFHSKISWNAQSLSAFGVSGDDNDLFLIMFHDHVWYDKSLNAHLSNPLIFIGFPLNQQQWQHGNSVPCYDKYDKPLKLCFNDIKWIFPVQCHEMFLHNWDCRTPYHNLRPVVENWYNCCTQFESVVKLNNKINKIESELSEIHKQLNVFFICVFHVFLLAIMFFCLFVSDSRRRQSTKLG